MKQDRKYFALVGLFVLIHLGKYSIDVGFSLQPYMLLLFGYYLFHLREVVFEETTEYEASMYLFYLYYAFTGVFSLFPESSLRIILGFILIISCYLLMKSLISSFSTVVIEKAVANAGLLFNGISLLLYIYGLKMLGFQLSSEGDEDIRMHGVLLDRDYPRLIGLLDDPNFYILHNTIFFAFYLTNLQHSKNRYGFLLAAVCNVLTFSRGGLAAMLLIIVMYIYIKRVKIWTLLKTFSFSIAIGFIVSRFTNFNIFEMIIDRMTRIGNDGGSGRFEIWEKALHYFVSSPVIGIGVFNFSDYYLRDTGKLKYAHNTFLEVLAESGVIGISLFLVMLVFIFAKLQKEKIYRSASYLYLAYFGILIQIFFLSSIPNEMFFLFLAVLYPYVLKGNFTSRIRP
ncbi:O-antigen ligase family protein [Mesobacillus selenatarsenatis]|uniref:Oligosaccharide repeat unit polymerase Wzy n=1 Tax=Mesobacillus selenatarsenatis (strain DSM 18680 / JCM 14380 / FERM P-15431 / SF-1) TaxID=1321606 RepID=A0A0A8X649_MESS1|nr:O-antigen ligase family protein [Mesobacillus selenatarsenatis]GAM15410.1 oligosaccharide repeat unit polymerase Wzy [Mesobacillus selenatarsenatis SF-1]